MFNSGGYANFGHHIQQSSKAETCTREFWIMAPSNDKAAQMRSVTMIGVRVAIGRQTSGTSEGCQNVRNG